MADWQKGDLARCVTGKRPGSGSAEAEWPHKFMIGGVYLVTEVLFDGRGLVIDGKPSRQWHRAWAARAFVKVPPHEADEFDREVISLMTTNPSKVEA